MHSRINQALLASGELYHFARYLFRSNASRAWFEYGPLGSKLNFAVIQAMLNDFDLNRFKNKDAIYKVNVEIMNDINV